MSYPNGRIPTSALTRIYCPAGPAYLRHDAAIAFEDMRRESLKRFGIDLYPGGTASAYRTYAQQVYFWNLYRSGRGNLAAYPGTSNHGWGVAVDLASPKMRWVVDKIGYKYGWKKTEAFSEWWHVNYVGGYKRPAKPKPKLTKKERAVVTEYRYLRALHNPTSSQVARRKQLWHWMADQRKRIYRAAKRSGWSKYNRRYRYTILRRLTK